MNMPTALRIIRDEHAALAAVLRSMTMLVRDARRRNRGPEFGVLRAMLFYVDEFPERLHHVKESTMLFPRLRECAPATAAVLARLDAEHKSGGTRIRELEHKLVAWELLGEPRREAFETTLDAYVAFYLEHMRIEEQEILPLAETHFGEADWMMLDRAFGAHRDPLVTPGPEAPYVELFRSIVNCTPAPYGLGEPAPT
jgi:hemerythrin-like domain-containing protein